MPLANCEECGVLFLKTVSPLCPKCLAAEEADFERIRLLLLENPGLTSEEIQERTGIRLDRILKFIRSGRLKAAGLRCERCGRPITEGRYCEECFEEIKNEVREATKKSQPEAGGKVYTERWFREK